MCDVQVKRITLAFVPGDGMKVLIRGYVSVYSNVTASTSLYAEEMQPDGVGALYVAFEAAEKEASGRGIF
jgi:exodeoxyribonuclease VII large subunit